MKVLVVFCGLAAYGLGLGGWTKGCFSTNAEEIWGLGLAPVFRGAETLDSNPKP